MSNVSGIVFIAKNLDKSHVKGKRVIDVGSYNFNGSIRPYIESLEPNEYLGVDLLEGEYVDIVCNADDLVSNFGKESFDLVVCSEMLEHTKNWNATIHNIKNICKRGGTIFITTRSYGYPCHGFPNDYWRYEINDMKNIFNDFEIIQLENDSLTPGVFMKARKPKNFTENDLSQIKLYSILINKKTNTLNNYQNNSHYKGLLLKNYLRNIVEVFSNYLKKLFNHMFQIIFR